MSKCYIAGPMRGSTGRQIMQRFSQGAAYVALFGFEPVNPAEIDYEALSRDMDVPHDPPRDEYEKWMERDLNLIEDCDAICLLEGWRNSEGARREFRKARARRLLIIEMIYNQNGPCGLRALQEVAK